MRKIILLLILLLSTFATSSFASVPPVGSGWRINAASYPKGTYSSVHEAAAVAMNYWNDYYRGYNATCTPSISSSNPKAASCSICSPSYGCAHGGVAFSASSLVCPANSFDDNDSSCTCDEGYQESEDGLSCEPIPEPPVCEPTGDDDDLIPINSSASSICQAGCLYSNTGSHVQTSEGTSYYFEAVGETCEMSDTPPDDNSGGLDEYPGNPGTDEDNNSGSDNSGSGSGSGGDSGNSGDSSSGSGGSSSGGSNSGGSSSTGGNESNNDGGSNDGGNTGNTGNGGHGSGGTTINPGGDDGADDKDADKEGGDDSSGSGGNGNGQVNGQVNGDGSGSGNGDGTGQGNGNGQGNGDDSGQGNGNGNSDGTGSGDGQGNEDGIGDVPGLPDLPDGLYEPKYPDGLQGVWDDKKEQLKGTALVQLVDSLMPKHQSGSCPSWTLDLDLGGQWGFGVHMLEPPCWIWSALRALVLVGALLLARRLVFGG